MKEKKLILPKTIIKAETINPRNLILFSKPKIGKTSAIAQLPNCLIIDLEKGSKMIDAMKVEANDINEFMQIAKAIKEDGYPYDYIAIDTITKLEEMIIPLAEDMYSKTPQGKNWFTEGKPKYGSVLALPSGGGYLYTRNAFTKIINLVKTLAPNIILSGHVKDTLLDKGGVEFNSMDLDLSGKLKRMLASDSDSIGYMYRKGNQNFISFVTSDEVSCGSRSMHLRNKEILISELKGDTLETYWDNIYKPKN